MKRKFAALLLILVLICGLSIPASAELNIDVRNSVVVVNTCLDTPQGEIHFGTGTGFFINEQHLLTHYLVVEKFLQYGSGEQTTVTTDSGELTGQAAIRIYFNSSTYTEATIVAYDRRKGIAILRLDAPTTDRVPLELLVPTDDMVSSEVYAVGYSGLTDNSFVGAAAPWSKTDAIVTAGTIGRLFTHPDTGQMDIQIDCAIEQGNSGGPVVTGDGYVVGVAQWGAPGSDLESINFAVNIQEAILLLDQYDIVYSTAPAEKPENEATGEENSPERKMDLALILISVAAVLIILVLLVVIVCMKQHRAAPAVTVVSAAPVVPDVQPIVRSYAKANYGTVVRVGSQPLLIGRSGNCAMQFPNDAPGVSGNHCSVQWDPAARDFIVTDMNSTYGTFLMYGQKMQPNQPYHLRAGDRFYLAEQSNTIELSTE